MRKVIFIGVISFVFFACEREEVRPTTGAVTGFVFDANTGEPRQGVNVHIGSVPPIPPITANNAHSISSFVTGSDGMFVFENVPEEISSFRPVNAVWVINSNGHLTRATRIRVNVGQTTNADLIY